MKRFIKLMGIFFCVFLVAGLSACKQGNDYVPSRLISVVLLNGNHYSVIGENKQYVEKGGTAIFEIELERGYKAVAYFGDDCIVSEVISFRQTVTFENVNYNMTSQIKTEELSVSNFEIACDSQMGDIQLTSMLGAIDKNSYYEDDRLNLTAIPNNGYIFICWSSEDYISNGGKFYSYNPKIENFDFLGFDSLYANFKEISNIKLVYKMGNDIEFEQDCSLQLLHHYRPNTYTAVDMRDKGVDFNNRLLAGWRTEEGKFIGLGSRIDTVEEETVLFPVWKDYASSNDFAVENGIITRFYGTPDNEGAVVIPDKIDNETITAIAANAFENCTAKSFYIPDSVVTVYDDAFLNCLYLEELYMSDNIMSISDNAFSGCVNFETLHINAYFKPRYSKEQESVISDNYDRLALNAESGVKKVVVLGGSGVQSSYSCSVISDMFEEIGEFVDVYNFGWSAAYCGLAQFEIINHYLNEGDIFLHVPEHYEGALCGKTDISPITNEECIALTEGYPYIYRLCESNWDFISHLTVNEFSNLFNMFSVFNEYRIKYLPECEYSDYCDWAVESGYGYRTTNEQVFYENGTDKSFGGVLDIVQYASRFELTKKYMYEKIAEGVNLYVSFPAVNRANLILTYGDEEKVKEATDEYTRQVKEVLSDVNLQVLLTQYDTVYEGRYFFNHDYHLGYPCRDAHTRKIISALIEKLN